MGESQMYDAELLQIQMGVLFVVPRQYSKSSSSLHCCESLRDWRFIPLALRFFPRHLLHFIPLAKFVKKNLVSSLLMFLTRETISVLNWDEKGSSDDERTNIKQRPLGKKCHFGLGKRAIWEHSSPMSSYKSHLRNARRIFFNTGDRTVAEES